MCKLHKVRKLRKSLGGEPNTHLHKKLLTHLTRPSPTWHMYVTGIAVSFFYPKLYCKQLKIETNLSIKGERCCVALRFIPSPLLSSLWHCRDPPPPKSFTYYLYGPNALRQVWTVNRWKPSVWRQIVLSKSKSCYIKPVTRKYKTSESFYIEKCLKVQVWIIK